MAKFIILVLNIVLINFFSFSFNSYYLENPVDRCWIINLLNYKQNIPFVISKLQKYPALFAKTNSNLIKIMFYLKNNEKNYKKLINFLVNYSYNNNICKWTKKYLIISYIVYVLYDKYLNLLPRWKWDNLINYLFN